MERRRAGALARDGEAHLAIYSRRGTLFRRVAPPLLLDDILHHSFDMARMQDAGHIPSGWQLHSSRSDDDQATAAAIFSFLERGPRLLGCRSLLALLCPPAGFTITSISARCAST
jgi:hypothetical protein